VDDIDPLPEIDTRQLVALTDGTGMLQHAALSTPDLHHGYCTDDNARALIAATMHWWLTASEELLVPLQRYLAFLAYAFDPGTGRFRNFMAYDRRWLEEVGSEDSHGRAIWGLGAAVRYAPNDSIRELSSRLLRQALPALKGFAHLHPLAFALIGLDEFLRSDPDDAGAAATRRALAERYFEAWRENAADDWPWWEDVLTWGNAKLAHALFASGAGLGRDDMLEAGLRALRWVLGLQTAADGHLTIVGNRGWYPRGGRRARFDQQPLEAHGFVHACLAAAELTGEAGWAHRAGACFEWFVGKNDVGIPLYNPETGGCQDGLGPAGVNQNQGAESTLAYLLSVLELHRHARGSSSRAAAGKDALGYGLVGASAFGEFCLGHYSGIEGLKPVAVWSRTAAKAETLASRRGMRACATLRELVSDPTVALVHVATIPSLHAEHAAAALSAGRHVLVEKPLATSLSDATHLLGLARERGLKLGVDFVMRYGPLWGPVRRLVESNILGAVLRGELVNCAGDEGLAADHWFWDESRSGGVFVEHGVHFFDLLRSWLGSGTVVAAQRLARPGTTLIDQVHCTVRYGAQTTVGFYHGFHQPSPLDRQELRLVFERGGAVLTGWVAGRIAIRALLDEEGISALAETFEGSEVETLGRFEGPSRRMKRRGVEEKVDREVRLTWSAAEDGETLYGRAVRSLMEDFLASIRDPDHRPRVTAEDGRAALELALEADRLTKST
jgi:predicted dehydrogenase